MGLITSLIILLQSDLPPRLFKLFETLESTAEELVILLHFGRPICGLRLKT